MKDYPKEIVKLAIESVERQSRGITGTKTSVEASNVVIGGDGVVSSDITVRSEDSTSTEGRQYNLDGLLTWIHALYQVKQA